MTELPIDNIHAPLYTVGQVATMLQVQPAFLRRLESEDLIMPERSEGGQRRYTRAEIDRIHRVTELAGEGLTLAGIRRLLVLEAEVEALRAEVRRLDGPVGGPCGQKSDSRRGSYTASTETTVSTNDPREGDRETAATSRPTSTAVAAVTGPMQTTTGGPVPAPQAAT